MNSSKDMRKYYELKQIEINNLIENGHINRANEKYQWLLGFFNDQQFEIANSVKIEIYISYAFFLFNCSEYEGFFEMLLNAQKLGYQVKEIEQTLWDCFVEPNISEFRNNYNYNLEKVLGNKINEEDQIDFEQLSYWLLPTGNLNEFYIYDKGSHLLVNKIVYTIRKNLSTPIPNQKEFSDYVIAASDDIGQLISDVILVNRLNKKSYIILGNIELFLAGLQGKKLEQIVFENNNLFLNVESLMQHLEDSKAFLPRNIIGNENITNIVNSKFEDLHKKRVSNKSKRNNILLSVCIPTYNRGKRAYDNVMHLLNSAYDEEIEIVVSNNGTKNETSSYYDKIQQMTDNRVKYFMFEENRGFAINCSKVCELAEGKYILLLSDEDMVDFNTLDKTLEKLKNQNEIALIRTTTTFQSKPPVIEASAGRESLLNFMLTSNYMSGIILNNGLLKEHKGIEYIEKNIDNSVCYHYPHMYWELLLAQYGKVIGSDLVLVKEGAAEKTEVEEVSIGTQSIPSYASLEGRLNQHQDFHKIFNSLTICQQNKPLFREMYIKLTIKTIYLTMLSINVFYKKQPDCDLKNILQQAYNYCTDRKFFVGNSREYKNDLKVIEQYYKSFVRNLK